MISVLYIDDDQVFLDLGRQYMERDADIRVDTTHSAKESLELLKTENFDAIIAEYELPDSDGILFLKTVREKFPHIPFIFFTRKRREEIFIDALCNGADYHVRKGKDTKSQFAELSHVVKLAVELRESDQKNARISRIDSILRHFNEAVIHVHDRMQMIQEVCKIMVTEGGFAMAWVGFEDRETHRIKEVIASGIVDDFFVKVRMASDDVVNGYGPAVTAIRKGKYFIINDIQAYPDMQMWEEEALHKGYQSAAAFPISTGKTISGAITFYSYDRNFFTDAEIQLLNGLTEDIAFVLTAREMEETQKQVQDELECSEHQLTEIINFFPTATFAVDTNDSVIFWNKAMEKLTQVSAGQIIGEGNYEYSLHIFGERIPALLDLIFAPDSELERYHYSAIQRTGTTLRAQIPFINQKGKTVPLEIIAAPLYDCQGLISGAIESIYNLAETGKNSERYHCLFETTDYGILLLEADTKKIIDANPFIVTLTGNSREQLLGRTLEETGLFKDSLKVEQFFAELIKTGFFRSNDVSLQTQSGRIIDVELVSRVIPLDDHAIIQCSFYDVFDQKRAENARVLALKTLNMFSSMIRHDILNQLMVVSGSLELASYTITEPAVLKHTNRAQTATKTIQRQIIFTREYENLGTDAPTWQAAATVIHQAFLEVQADSISLNMQEKDDIFDVFADPLFYKVFFLLFSYSLKYGEHVTKIDVNFQHTSTELIITVADNGIGITPENKVHLFEWRAADDKTHGLFLSQKILANTGITIRETGEFEKGIRFEIIVPAGNFKTGSRRPA